MALSAHYARLFLSALLAVVAFSLCLAGCREQALSPPAVPAVMQDPASGVPTASCTAEASPPAPASAITLDETTPSIYLEVSDLDGYRLNDVVAAMRPREADGTPISRFWAYPCAGLKVAVHSREPEPVLRLHLDGATPGTTASVELVLLGTSGTVSRTVSVEVQDTRFTVAEPDDRERSPGDEHAAGGTSRNRVECSVRSPDGRWWPASSATPDESGAWRLVYWIGAPGEGSRDYAHGQWYKVRFESGGEVITRKVKRIPG